MLRKQFDGLLLGSIGCGPGFQPVYLSNCKEGVWSRQNQLALCTWCTSADSSHLNAFNVPLRIESSIFLLDDWLLYKLRDENGDYSEIRTGHMRSIIGARRGRCKGYLPAQDRFNEAYMLCKGDGRTCFHARWK